MGVPLRLPLKRPPSPRPSRLPPLVQPTPTAQLAPPTATDQPRLTGPWVLQLAADAVAQDEVVLQRVAVARRLRPPIHREADAELCEAGGGRRVDGEEGVRR